MPVNIHLSFAEEQDCVTLGVLAEDPAMLRACARLGGRTDQTLGLISGSCTHRRDGSVTVPAGYMGSCRKVKLTC